MIKQTISQRNSLWRGRFVFG